VGLSLRVLNLAFGHNGGCLVPDLDFLGLGREVIIVTQAAHTGVAVVIIMVAGWHSRVNDRRNKATLGEGVGVSRPAWNRLQLDEGLFQVAQSCWGQARAGCCQSIAV